ncbi:MAG: MBL fold metallo-hydrolase [Candidatus Aenigmatarchaeota archaeon]
MEIEILGAAREVGRSAISVRDRNTNIIMDYGLKLQEIENIADPVKKTADNSPKPPASTRKVSAIFLSHAHLDHCGALPMLYRKETPPLYTTALSLELANLMIMDSIKIARKEKYKLNYGKSEVEKMNRCARILNYNQPIKVGDFTCTLFDAGHIPGSAGILLKHKSGKKVFYTGDINTIETELLKPCILPEKVDILITESTYGIKQHPDRNQEKKSFFSEVSSSVKLGKPCLIPVFAIGRSQEVFLMLEKYADSMVIDGMTKSASEIMLNHRKYLKDPKRLSRILDKVTWVYSDKEREIAVKQFPLIVTTAGMMSGGPVLFYLRNIKANPESKILFTGYLIKGTPAKNLLKSNVFKNAKEEYNVLSSLHQYDFSAHTDNNGLMEIIRSTKPEHVICVHGDCCQEFAKNILTDLNKPMRETHQTTSKSITPIKTYAPKLGDIIKF